MPPGLVHILYGKFESVGVVEIPQGQWEGVLE
jgi:hypothetical protein